MAIGDLDFSLREGDNILLWQYSNTPRLSQIVQNEIAFFKENAQDFFSNWYNDVFNLKTANSFGLNVWGFILGLPRLGISPANYIIDQDGDVLRLYNQKTEQYHTIWLEGDSPKLSVELNPTKANPYPLQIEDEPYRRCLMARLLLLNSNLSIKSINEFLFVLFGGKPVFARDNFDMTIDIIFKYYPSDVDLVVLTTPELSPRPMGVEMNYRIDVGGANYFGFKDTNLKTWKQGTGTSQPTNPDGHGTFSNL